MSSAVRKSKKAFWPCWWKWSRQVILTGYENHDVISCEFYSYSPITKPLIPVILSTDLQRVLGSKPVFSKLCDRPSVSLRVKLDTCLLRNYQPISHHFLIGSHTETPTQWSHKSASRGSVGSSTLDINLAAGLPSYFSEAVRRKPQVKAWSSAQEVSV